MRLLAYGGTSYNERQRIGAWSEISRGALEDTYGLPEQTLIYGLGVLDEQPFLVVRQRQLTETGRAYAFSLLLDPGEEVWKRFEWNAAGLACALFDEQQSLGHELLARPEDFTEDALTRRLEALRPPATPERVVRSSDDFLACWLGAPHSDAPVTVSPERLGFDARPTPTEIFTRTTALPVCFQLAMGWLVGGSHESGQAFGSRLVLDDSAVRDERAETAARECVANGVRVFRAWQAIAADREFAPTLMRLSALPLWSWEADDKTLAPAALLDRLMLLAELLKDSTHVETLLQSLRQRLEGSAFLSAEIRRAAQRLALSGVDPLNSTRTSLLLVNHFDEELKLPPTVVPRLHRETTIKFFVDRAIPPDEPGASSLSIPSDWRRDIWVRLLGAAQAYAQVPALLRYAADDEIAAGTSRQSRERFDVQLLEAVRTQTLTTGDGSLLVWDSYPREHAIWPGVAAILRDEALRRALRRGQDWKREYLLYGEDAGGVTLHERGFEPADAPLIVKFCRDEMRAGSAHAQAAAAWLMQLAESSLRREVSVRDKVEVAELVGGKWQFFTHLWRLYRGQRQTIEVDGSPAQTSMTKLERDILRGELSQLTKESPVRDFVPDLRGLVEFLGELPEEAVKYFAHSHPRLSSKNFDSWIGGWKALKMSERAEEETVRFITDSDGAVPDGWLFRGFSDLKIENLFHRLLFCGSAQDDARLRAKFEQLLAQKGDRPKLRAAVRRVYVSGQEDSEYRRVLLRRFVGHAGPLDALFRCLPSLRMQDRLVEDFASSDDGAFSDEVNNIYVAVHKSVAPITTYERAMLRYLLFPEGKGVKRKIARSVHFAFLNTKEVDAHLDEILSRPTIKYESEEENAASVTESNGGAEVDSSEISEEDTQDTAAPRAKAKPSSTTESGSSPSLFGKALGFMKSLIQTPELDSETDAEASVEKTRVEKEARSHEDDGSGHDDAARPAGAAADANASSSGDKRT